MVGKRTASRDATRMAALERRLKSPRIEPGIRYLKPIKRITKVKGKKYTHYIIATTVPKEWKDGVEVIIKPQKGDIKEIRRTERDLYQMNDPVFVRMIDEHIEERTKEAERLIKKIEEFDRRKEGYRRDEELRLAFEEFEKAPPGPRTEIKLRKKPGPKGLIVSRAERRRMEEAERRIKRKEGKRR